MNWIIALPRNIIVCVITNYNIIVTHTICRMHNYVLICYAFYYKQYIISRWATSRKQSFLMHQRTLFFECIQTRYYHILIIWWNRVPPTQEGIYNSFCTQRLEESLLYKWSYASLCIYRVCYKMCKNQPNYTINYIYDP